MGPRDEGKERPVAMALCNGLLSISLLLLANPGMGLVTELGHDQQVVAIQRVGILPLITVLVASIDGHVVERSLLAFVSPD